MSDPATEDQQVSNDDWAAALNEQSAAGAPEAEPEPAGSAEPAAANPAVFEQFDAAAQRPPTRNDIDLVMDIPVQLTVELGRTKLSIRNLLQLAQGSVVELDGLAGEPMDVLVNGCLIAQGEVVVVNEKFGIRLTDVITPGERIKRLNK
jgi:flagellar motor switch protein FliN/FliY